LWRQVKSRRGGKIMNIVPAKFKGLYEQRKGSHGSSYYTKNLVPGASVYGETLVHTKGVEYREWDPTRSKVAAAIHKKISQLGIYPGSTVLYLGASTGTTVSHISDLVGEEGFVFALDFAPVTTKGLVLLSETRPNIAPVLGNAMLPETYANQVSQVDAIIQDIAQRAQPETFIKNVEKFLKPGGFGFLSIKARSIDVTKHPKDIFLKVRKYLEKHIIIVDYRELSPLEKDHCVFICKKKNN